MVCGAVIHGTVGGTVCAALAAVGCLALIRMIAVDVGWAGGDAERAAPPAEPLPDPDPGRE